MTKKELEIRLKVAESIIKESSYLLSDENVNKISQERDKDYARAYAIGQTIHNLEYYDERAKQAIECGGKDIHLKEVR